jgi:hypothetical protein
MRKEVRGRRSEDGGGLGQRVHTNIEHGNAAPDRSVGARQRRRQDAGCVAYPEFRPSMKPSLPRPYGGERR